MSALRSSPHSSRVRAALGSLLAFASAHCAATTDPTEETVDDATMGTGASALTTPNGSNWIVLPRPPARVSRIFADAYVAPFAQAGSGFTATPTTATSAEGQTSLAVNLAVANATYGVQVTTPQAYAGAGQTELSFAFNAGATVHAGIDTLRVAVEDDDAATATTFVALKPYLVTTGSVAANTWYRVTIPTSVLNPGGRAIRRVLFANQSALTNVSFFSTT